MVELIDIKKYSKAQKILNLGLFISIFDSIYKNDKGFLKSTCFLFVGQKRYKKPSQIKENRNNRVNNRDNSPTLEHFLGLKKQTCGYIDHV